MKKKTSVKPSSAAQVRHDIASRIRGIWEGAQTQAARSVNTAHVVANWLIGKEIVEEQQEGRERAKYGDQLLKKLSEELQTDLGTGFALTSLKLMRQFFLAYPSLQAIRHPVGDELLVSLPENAKSHPLGDELTKQRPLRGNWKPGLLHPNLSWRHYRTLMAVDRPARDFYEIEAIKCNWTGRQLERQISSLLYERLAKSRDKAGVLALANEGNVVSSPLDLIKEPFVLEFLKLPESHLLTETELETTLLVSCGGSSFQNFCSAASQFHHGAGPSQSPFHPRPSYPPALKGLRNIAQGCRASARLPWVSRQPHPPGSKLSASISHRVHQQRLPAPPPHVAHVPAPLETA